MAEKQPTRVVLEVGGVGYEVFVPLSTFDRLPAKGETCRILTYDHVREDAHQLFGFQSEAERVMFLQLLGVSGIGPKIALGTLSGMSVRDLKAAVVEGDTKRLSSVSGIGRKLAERIVVELRHKISAGEALEAVAGAGEETPDSGKARDAVLALVALGYTQEAARKVVAGVARGAAWKGLSVEEIVKRALGGTSGR
jgi:Holliday junction DNA helicase RuvA